MTNEGIRKECILVNVVDARFPKIENAQVRVVLSGRVVKKRR